MRIEKLRRLLSLSALFAIPALMYGSANPPAPQSLEAKVRHQLNMLPYYGVFDNLSFRVDGDKVTLFGEVARPVVKYDAESAIKHLEGVSQVESHIEVLPLSNFDDQIRVGTARAIYGYPALSRYALGTHPPIHIVVKNGNVKLEGVVANEMDRNLAYLRANGIPGAFSVTNDLRIDSK